MASHQYPHFWRVVPSVRCTMDSSRSAQRAVIQFLRTEGQHASQIYRRLKEVYREQCLARCTFRRCQRYEADAQTSKTCRTKTATISAVDELIQQRNCASHNPQKAWLW
ncbi:hypothetical protein AVEN_103074-1 [Araneus ventricosus]|uniref:Mos1 transposase HTH domain-containing protein n=1 Tax=Araneus ventricosus TaxID=182803 RepID=A0A4Y2BAY6_ARAVE|nr:hypothetical protein AVEN_103074-1 [Araneus ventricosus]